MAVRKLETARGFSAIESANTTFSNTTAEQTLFSHTIVGRRMGSDKTLTFRIVCAVTTVVSVPNLSVTVKFGSSSLVLLASAALVINATNAPLVIQGLINNKTSASQFAYAVASQDAIKPVGSASGVYAAIADWTEDTTADKVLSVTSQFGVLSLTTSITFRYGDIVLT